MNKIGIITTGGDAPGMNAAIRATTRIACSKKINVVGFKRGWEGLLTNNIIKLTPRSVGGIIHLGGTILHTVRCPEFKKTENVEKAAMNLEKNKIDGLLVIGGDGSFKGALDLSKKSNSLMVGIPASIDNDVNGTDETIGFDTAVNTAVDIIDKIRDTAISHDRLFVVEVMGKERGFLALTVGLTVGAEVILIPEEKYPMDQILKTIRENSLKGKKAGIIVAAEGVGDNAKFALNLQESTNAEVRLSIVGYAQRGGSPTARSRLLANLFAEKAIESFLENRGNRAIVLKNNAIENISLEKCCEKKKPVDLSLLKLSNMLSL